MDNRPIRVLLVDDDEDDYIITRDLLSEIEGGGYDLEWVAAYDVAVEAIGHNQHDVYLIDYRLGERNGLELLREALRDGCKAPMILLTGQGDREVDIEAMEAGAADYLVKGQIDAPLLERSIRYAMEHKRAQEQIQREVQRLDVQREITQAVTSALDLRTVLDILMEKMDLLLPYSAVLMWLLDRQNGELVRVACRNLNEEEWKRRDLKGTPALPKTVVETGRPVVVRNIQIDPRTRDPDFFRKLGLVSYLGVPMIAKGEVLGVLSFLTREGDQFGSEEIEFLSTLASQAAVAIHNSQLYEQTKEQKVELERASKMKADFTAMIVHDLRSPLTAVVSAAGMLEDGLMGPVNENQKKWLTKIGAAARSLVDLISQFLDLSKIEAGRIELVREEMDLKQFIRDCLDNYLPLARDKKLSFKSCVDPALPRIDADPRRLEQVLSNLLSNAIKFGGEGGEIEVGASQGGTGEIKVWVKDNGVGIPAHEIGNLFEMYRQAKSGRASKYEGTGLGLVICKMIVEAHGGRIWAESEEGKGTTFVFLLPINQQGSGSNQLTPDEFGARGTTTTTRDRVSA
ncbi:MAG: ATP-binding protein [Anaerolineae bacterium]